MGEHLIKRHNLSKITTQSSLSSVTQNDSTTPAIIDNAPSPFIAITPEQYSNFRLALISWMVKSISLIVKLRMTHFESLLPVVLWELSVQSLFYLVQVILSGTVLCRSIESKRRT